MFENKKILVLGMARSGYEAAKYLVKHGNTVILNDGGSAEKQKKEQIEELEKLGVTLIFGSHPDDLLDDTFDYLIKNPGIPIDHKYVLKARELNIEVINEAELIKLMEERADLKYVTDIMPAANEEFAAKFAGRYFSTPKKMGAQTAEANINAGIAAAKQIEGFLKEGCEKFRVNKS